MVTRRRTATTERSAVTCRCASLPRWFAPLDSGRACASWTSPREPGLIAEAALSVVGPTGHVTAADLSPAMLGNARERLGRYGNCSIAVEDGQFLSFADSSFDVVLCNLGLIFFTRLNSRRGLPKLSRRHSC